jgi:hypothetical protein
MDLETAIELIKKAVKNSGNIDQKHIDLSLIPAKDLESYKEALKVSQMAIKEGKITRDEFLRAAHLDT